MGRYEIINIEYNKETDVILVRVHDSAEARTFVAEIHPADIMKSRILRELTPGAKKEVKE